MDVVTERMNILKEQAKYRTAVPVETKRINPFAPITAEESKQITEKLREAKALQREKLRSVDIADLGKDYERAYQEFLQGLSRSDNRLQQACTAVAVMKEYSQILRCNCFG